MKWTRANVAEHAQACGLEPEGLDGIPDGFLWKKPDLQIGDRNIITGYQLYIPLKDIVINSTVREELLTEYKHYG